MQNKAKPNIILLTTRPLINRRENALLVKCFTEPYNIINVHFGGLYPEFPIAELLSIEYYEIDSFSKLTHLSSRFKTDPIIADFISDIKLSELVYNQFVSSKVIRFQLSFMDELLVHSCPKKLNIIEKINQIRLHRRDYYFGLRRRLFKLSCSPKVSWSNTRLVNVTSGSKFDEKQIRIPPKEYFSWLKFRQTKINCGNNSRASKQIAYIDQNLNDHPDYINFKGNNAYFNYKNLRSLFHNLQKDGYQISFCPHPSVSVEHYINIKLDLGDSVNLYLETNDTHKTIVNAEYLIGHYSNALIVSLFSMAPLLLLDDEFFRKNNESKHLYKLASIFKIPYFDLVTILDEQSPIKLFNSPAFKCDTNYYYDDEKLLCFNNYYNVLCDLVRQIMDNNFNEN